MTQFPDLTPRRVDDNCLSDFSLDLLVAGAAENASAQRQHLLVCRACRERYDELLVAVAPLDGLAELRVRPKRSPSRRGVGWVAITLAAAAGFVIALRQTNPTVSEEAPTRTKGGASLGFFVERGSRVFRWHQGDQLQANDALRFTYSSSQSSYLTVIARDGAGTLTTYFPPTNSAERVEAASNAKLNQATLLDDVLGQEHVYGFFCTNPVEPSAHIERLRAGNVGAPRGCELVELDYEKK